MEQQIGVKKGEKSYSAQSLSDIATFIGSLAAKEEQLASSHSVKREQLRHRSWAAAYRDAERMLNDCWITYEGLAQEVKRRLDTEHQREAMLNTLMSVLSMDDLDDLKERLP